MCKNFVVSLWVHVVEQITAYFGSNRSNCDKSTKFCMDIRRVVSYQKITRATWNFQNGGLWGPFSKMAAMCNLYWAVLKMILNGTSYNHEFGIILKTFEFSTRWYHTWLDCAKFDSTLRPKMWVFNAFFPKIDILVNIYFTLFQNILSGRHQNFA